MPLDLQNSIPIIIFHIGNQDYLRLSIKQAENYGNNVILIGDENNEGFCKNHYNYKDYFNSEFDKIYKHVSPNNEAFEKICIQRWFIIKNLMKKLDIKKAFICDSDVLIYRNINDIMYSYKEYIHFVSMNNKIPTNAAISIWSLNTLTKFTNFIDKFYNLNNWENILDYWSNYNDKLSGGISDMYLLYCFISNKTFKDIKFNF